MSLHNDRYRELVDEHFGGMDAGAMEQFFYANNPLALKHWTMNVIEVMMIFGALWGLHHAWRAIKERSDPTGMCIWWASVVFLFVVEVPIYFPEIFGRTSNQVFFIHNEFSLGLLFNMTPLYIFAFYPAFCYGVYLLVKQAGIFDQRFGTVLGAISGAFVFLCFYQIFDQFGPQYGWWLWDRENPFLEIGLASVPYGSIVGYSLSAPLVMFLLIGVIIRPYVKRRLRADKPWRAMDRIIMAALAVITGVLTPFMIPFAYPPAYYAIITSTRDSSVLLALYWGIMMAVVAIGVWQFTVRSRVQTRRFEKSEVAAFKYIRSFFTLYLIVFVALWAYAAPEYFRAEDGLTDRGTPIGSIWFVLACYLGGGLILLKTHQASAQTA